MTFLERFGSNLLLVVGFLLGIMLVGVAAVFFLIGPATLVYYLTDNMWLTVATFIACMIVFIAVALSLED
jgi:hypothetical protein